MSRKSGTYLRYFRRMLNATKEMMTYKMRISLTILDDPNQIKKTLDFAHLFTLRKRKPEKFLDKLFMIIIFFLLKVFPFSRLFLVIIYYIFFFSFLLSFMQNIWHMIYSRQNMKTFLDISRFYYVIFFFPYWTF